MKYKTYIIEIITTILGTIIMAIGVSFFLLPSKLSSGGFTGIATITYYLFKWNVGTVILILNIPLFAIAFFKLGKKFFIKGIIGTISLSYFIDIFQKMNSLTYDRFLACIYGGIIIGIGSAITLKAEGSTGGTDMLTYIIRKYKPNYRAGNLLVLLDTIIVVTNVLVFKEIEIGLYSKE